MTTDVHAIDINNVKQLDAHWRLFYKTIQEKHLAFCGELLDAQTLERYTWIHWHEHRTLAHFSYMLKELEKRKKTMSGPRPNYFDTKDEAEAFNAKFLGRPDVTAEAPREVETYNPATNEKRVTWVVYTQEWSLD